MASNDVSNLGLEADLPDELRRISADTEYDILLRYLGVNPATLNSDIWERADQERIVGTIARNISGHIAGTRHALTQLQLENLLNPRVQEAAAAVQRQNLGTPEGRQSVATVLAQAVYDALPKETWHVVIERQIRNQYGGGRVDTAPPTAEEQAALSFYERLREENDANDMIAGMALLTAINDTTTSPVAIPAAGTTPARQSWEQKYLSNNTEVVQRKNVAETVLKLRSFQSIVLPSGISHNANRRQVSDALSLITDGTIGHIRRINDHLTTWAAAEANNQVLLANDENAMNQWQADKRDNEQQEARRQSQIVQLQETYRQECAVVRDENRAAMERHRNECNAIEQANQRDLDAYRAATATLVSGGTPPPQPTPRPLPPPPTFTPLPAPPTPPPVIIPLRPSPAKSILAQFTPLTLTGAFGATLASAADAREKQVEYATIATNLQAAMDEFTRRENVLNELLRLIQALNVQNLPATFPTLSSIAPGTPPVLNLDLVTANFDFAALATEIERNMPKGLKSVEEYSKEVVESGAKRTGGMDLCRAVMRAHVKNARPGLSNADTDSVVEYIVNRTKVDNILRSSVQQGVNEYFDVDGDRTLKERLQNSWNANGRHAETVEQIGRGLRIGVIGHQPNWQAASYEQLVGAYFAIKELVEGKGPEYLHMTSRPPAVLEQLQTISRILTSKYSGAIEKKLAASLPDADKKDVTRSRARLGQAMQDFLKGDAPEWAKADVKKAHDRANAYVDWKRRGTYALGKSFVSGVGGVGSWMKNFAVGNSPSGDVVKQYGGEAAKIAAWSLLGGPVLGVAAWYLSKQFSSAK